LDGLCLDPLAACIYRELLENQCCLGEACYTIIACAEEHVNAFSNIQLPAKELDQLAHWLEDCRARMWDEQIGKDLAAGRLDTLLAEVDKEYKAGLSQPLRSI
jgi:hypothetical protein